MTKIANKIFGLTTILCAITFLPVLGYTQDSIDHQAQNLNELSPAAKGDIYQIERHRYYIDSLNYHSVLAKAENGNNLAQYELGNIYRFGHGVTKSDVVALMWYVISERNGRNDAQKDRKLTENYMAFDQKRLAYQMADRWLRNHSTTLN